MVVEYLLGVVVLLADAIAFVVFAHLSIAMHLRPTSQCPRHGARHLSGKGGSATSPRVSKTGKVAE
jgi:hypothetical protein